MKYWIFTCLAVGLVLGDEAIAWICLAFAFLPPIIKFGFAWSKEMQKDDRVYGGFIDDEGYYE